MTRTSADRAKVWAALMNRTVSNSPTGKGRAAEQAGAANRQVVDPAGELFRVAGHADDAGRQPAGGDAARPAAFGSFAVGGKFSDDAGVHDSGGRTGQSTQA